MRRCRLEYAVLLGWLFAAGCMEGKSELPSANASPATAQQALTLPPNFSDALIAAVASPTALAFTPDGRVLVTTQMGTLRVIQGGSLLPSAALSLSSKLCTNSERGLLGVAVDPGFASNRRIYLYYTFRKAGVCTNDASDSPVNRVSRFTLADSNLVDQASELVLIDNIPSSHGNHNGGDLQFGKDGNLYVSVGDGGCHYNDPSRCAGNNPAARDASVLLGKILRIRPDGTIPSDNPFLGSDSDSCRINGRTSPGRKCRETYATGLRNPFRMAFDPNAAGTRFFINDVGQNTWEEIDLGQAGADYGWNMREGKCDTGSTSSCFARPGFVDPIHAYGRASGCASITGGAFVPNGSWPSSYDGAYLFADYVCGKIFVLKQSGSSWSSSEFASAAGSSSVVAMAFGSYQGAKTLVYTTYANGGELRRITFGAGGNQAPAASITAAPTFGAAPLTVQFDGSQSRDPDPGDTLTYSWSFGDGSPNGAGVNVSHTYAQAGVYSASLVVRDPDGAVSSAALATIQAGNSPPVPVITQPSQTATFTVGELLTLTGSASDAQDGTLPGSALSWSVLQHHNSHTHPYLPATKGYNVSLTAPAPEDLAATQTSFLELRLTATDSAGLSSTVTRQLNPRLVNISFASVPAAARLTVNGTSMVAPSSVVSWAGYTLNVDAPVQTGYTFNSWSDGGARAHAILTPSSAATYTASFQTAAVDQRNINVNFQPSGADVPAGYVADVGAPFGTRDAGRSYGWNVDNSATARDRNAGRSPDQRYDTFQHMQQPSNPNASWELQVPNGTYSVRVVVGEPNNWDSLYAVAAEGTSVVQGTPTSNTRWFDGTANVTVNDGRLTISNASGASNNKLCFLEVRGL